MHPAGSVKTRDICRAARERRENEKTKPQNSQEESTTCAVSGGSVSEVGASGSDSSGSPSAGAEGVQVASTQDESTSKPHRKKSKKDPVAC